MSKSKNKKLVIFDFDGVLVNTTDLWFEINKESNPDLSFEIYKDFSNGNFHEEVGKAVKSGSYVSGNDSHLVYHDKLQHHGVPPEIKSLIEKLSKDFLLFVVSSGRENSIEEHLEREGLLKYFEGIFGYNFHLSKTEKLKYVIGSEKVSQDSALFVTDTLGDIRESNEAGIRSIGVTWGLHNRETLSRGNPARIVENPLELETAIEDLLQ